jgi:PAS domain S-box-containing protein
MGAPPRASQSRRTPAASSDGGDAVTRALLAQLHGVVWAADAELRCRFVSPAAARRFRMAVGAPIAAAVDHPDLLQAHHTALAGTPGRVVLTVGGAVLGCEIEPLRDPTGAVIGVLVTADDLTEHDRAARLVEMQRAVFRATLEHSPNGISICDGDGNFIYSNAASRRFEEVASEGTSLADGVQVWGQWYDDAGPISVEQLPMARALRGETIEGVDVYTRLADGSLHHLHASAVPIRDRDGAILGVLATATDISTRKQLEEDLRALNRELEDRVQARTAELEAATRRLEREAVERSATLERLARGEQLLSDVVNHSSAIIYLKDLDGRYLLVNAQFEKLFHVRNEDQRGLTDRELFSPEFAEAFMTNDRLVLAAGEPMEFDESAPIDGVMRTYVSLKFPLRDRDGVVYGVCGMSTEITERKAMEAALRRSQATLSAIIESSSDPIVALDQEWQLVAMNAATAALIPSLIGMLPPMHAHLGKIPEEFAAPWRALIDRALAGERFTVERTLPVGDAPRSFSISFNPTVQDEAVTGVAIFGRETTEFRRAEEQARHHQAELAHVLRLHTMGEMAASLAHEVNQPLGAIANYAQGARNRIRAGDIGPAELVDVVEQIASQALRAGEITRRVRELLRKEEEPRGVVEVGELVAVAVGMIDAAARRQGITVSVSADPGPMQVLADRIQIEQVLLNLLLNAVDAVSHVETRRDVALHIGRAATDGTMVEVAVRDAGPGIEPAHEARIFEPFFTTKSGGLGMGLAISRSIIAAHGGHLWVTPTPGGGATFHFTLPTADA